MSVEHRLREGLERCRNYERIGEVWQHHPDSPPARTGTRYMERVNPGTDEFWRCLRPCARAVAAGASSR